MMDTKYLQDYLYQAYKEGFVPGPDEDFEAFQKRYNFVREVLANPEPFLQEVKVSYERVLPKPPLRVIRKKRLPFWFGAMTSIYTYQGYEIPVIELPKKPRHNQDEVLAHEQVHFLRSSFREPKFEEILAYRTSKAKWRQWIGPLFERPWESYLFLILALPLPLVAAAFALLLGTRLTFYQWVFKKALNNLPYKNREEIIALLTDREIFQIAFKKMFDSSSLRWQLITQIRM